MPEAPAPTTTRRLGSSLSAQASSVPMTRPPKRVPGIGFLIEPVATTMHFVTSTSSPSLLAPTRTVPAPMTVPWPSSRLILFFLKRPLTPPVRVLMTFRRRSETASKSTVGSDTLMPNSPASRTSSRTSATRRTAFAGMHA